MGEERARGNTTGFFSTKGDRTETSIPWEEKGSYLGNRGAAFSRGGSSTDDRVLGLAQQSDRGIVEVQMCLD